MRDLPPLCKKVKGLLTENFLVRNPLPFFVKKVKGHLLFGISSSVMDSAQLQSPGIEVLQSWGIATARHFSGRVVCPPSSSTDPSSSSTTSTDNTTEHLYDVPLGPSVVRWDLTTSKRLLQFQAHSDLIMSVRNSPDGCYIASSAYSGGVKLWSREWACLDSVSGPMESQFYVSETSDLRLQCYHYLIQTSCPVSMRCPELGVKCIKFFIIQWHKPIMHGSGFHGVLISIV